MKKLLLILFAIPVIGYSQKISKYKYGEVDTVCQYMDAQLISYKDKLGKNKRDTIWNSQTKQIIINWSHVVIQRDDYLKPRIKYTPKRQ